MHISMFSHEKINLATKEDMKYVNIGTLYTTQEKQYFIYLFK